MPDPSGAHELRYWNGSAWTEHVSDGGVTAVAPLVDAPPPPPPAPAAEAPARGGWKDKLKAAATQAAQQGKELADKAKEQMAEQQAKRREQWANDPSTLWFGQSMNPATGATGLSKATYRITKDRVWIDSGLVTTHSEHVPLWAVKDIDVRQSILQRNKDIGDVNLVLEDPTYSVDPNWTGTSSADLGGHTSGQLLLDNIEHPYEVRDLLLPLVSEARTKKTIERQSQYVHMQPPIGTPYGAPMQPPVVPPPAEPSEPKTDLADQLRKLADLRDAGVLTDEEFSSQKAKLLG
jgi:hypothetical protein